MELCFRITLLMSLLIGYLQANPVPTTAQKPRQFNKHNVPFDEMKQEVECGDMNFTSPTDVVDTCSSSAFDCFIGGLEQAENCAGDGVGRVRMTLGAIKTWYFDNNRTRQPCNWNNNESHKLFPDFVDDIKRCAEIINN